MSKELSSYEIDVSKLSQQVKSLTDKTNNLRNEQEKLNKDFKDGKINEEQYRKQTEKLANELKKTTNEMKNLKSATEKSTKDSSNAMGQFVDKTTSQMGALGGVIKNIFSGPAGIAAAVLAALKMISDEIKKRVMEAKELQDYLYSLDVSDWAERKDWSKVDNKAELERAKKNADYQVEMKSRFLKQLQQETIELAKQASALDMQDEKYKDIIEQIKQNEGVQKRTAKQLSNAKSDLTAINSKLNEINTKENQEAEKRKKAIEDEKKKRIELEKSIEDLKVDLIEDEKERKIAQLELTYNRTINDINEAEKTTTASNKKLFEQKKVLIKKVLDMQIKAIKEGTAKSEKEAEKAVDELHKYLNGIVFKFNMADPQLSTELKKAREELTAIEYENETLQNSLSKLGDDFSKNMADAYNEFIKKENEINEQFVNANTPEQQAELNRALLTAQAEYNNNRLVLEEEYNEQRELMEIETANKIKQIEKDTAVQTLNTWSNTLGGMGDLFNSLADLEDENSKKSLNLQKAAIYMNMASGLATGIANAAEAGWPAMLATIPATVAMLIGEFAQVKKLKSQSGYATGGLVLGAGSGTSDSINTNVSNGESVINAKATSMFGPLLSAINQSTGGAPINTANNQNGFMMQLATALQAMPNPVVSVQSINDQTAVYNNTVSLRSI